MSDNSNKTLIKAWLQKADDDFNFAKRTFEETEYYDHVCFLSEQAAEKYLKAVVLIIKKEIRPQDKTHNLIYLSAIGKEAGLNLDDLEEDLRKLQEAFIPSRYPANGYVKFTKEEAKECLESAEKIIDSIKEQINFSQYLKE